MWKLKKGRTSDLHVSFPNMGLVTGCSLSLITRCLGAEYVLPDSYWISRSRKSNGETGESPRQPVELLLRPIGLSTLGKIDGVRPHAVSHVFSLNCFCAAKVSSWILLFCLAHMAQYKRPWKWMVLLKKFACKNRDREGGLPSLCPRKYDSKPSGRALADLVFSDDMCSLSTQCGSRREKLRVRTHSIPMPWPTREVLEWNAFLHTPVGYASNFGIRVLPEIRENCKSTIIQD